MKPCPFCGNDEITIEPDPGGYSGYCHKCDCEGPFHPSADTAEKMWDERADKKTEGFCDLKAALNADWKAQDERSKKLQNIMNTNYKGFVDAVNRITKEKSP